MSGTIAARSRLHVAYLINQYPQVSHSFVRREIRALEAEGLQVDRYAVRGWDATLADPADVEERRQTRYLLQGGSWSLAAALLRLVVRRPVAVLAGLQEAWRLSRGAERSLVYHLIYLAEAARLVLWLQASGASHLHAHFGTNSAAVALLAHRLGGPGFSFTVHGPEEFDKPAALGLTRKIESSRFVVAISAFGRSQLFRWVAQPVWSRVQVVHCGLDAAFYAGVAAPERRVPAVNRFVCVGRLCEQKGQLLLVEALGLLRQQGREIHLVLAGDGEMRGVIEERARTLGVNSQLTITGWIGGDEVRRQLLQARAMVLPSFAEGLPVVIMEAMALRRPVISTYVAGIPELVQPGRTGWLVPASDIGALAAAMADCLDTDTVRLDAMGDQARARVLERHDIVTEARKLASLFRGASQPVVIDQGR